MWERNVLASNARSLTRVEIDDKQIDGPTITIDGRRLANFGSCAYLGLNYDDRLKAGAIDAIERYGAHYSSSTVYTNVGLYGELEERLSRIFGGTVIVPPTTTLGHIGALPVLIGKGDAVVIDAQTHASVHTATQLLIAEGTVVEAVPHADYDAAEATIEHLYETHSRVWYLADGVYSMWGDRVDMARVSVMLEKYPSLRAYIDDAHGVGWTGENGRGHVLHSAPLHPRMVVAASLAKSFGAGGAALVFADPEEARHVQTCAGTFIFSGPVHPPLLGAAIASADIHLSPELTELQDRIQGQIRLIEELAITHNVPLARVDATPIWFARMGGTRQSMELAARMKDDGFYVNISVFPAMPVGEGGVRFTNTLYNSHDDIEGFMTALGRNCADIASESDVVDLNALESSDDLD